jgi:antitoxin VapB
MNQVAKVFQNGRSQAVRLPAAFRFDTAEVFVRRDPATGDVILSSKPVDWEDLFVATDRAKRESAQFMAQREDGPPQAREIF